MTNNPTIDGEVNSLLISFPDQSKSFCYGFEAGIIWRELELGFDIKDRSVRVENKQLITYMFFHFKRRAVFEETIAEGWLNLNHEQFLSVVKV